MLITMTTRKSPRAAARDALDDRYAGAALRPDLEHLGEPPVAARCQTVDLTAPSAQLTYVEVLTPAGIIRVNAVAVDTRTGQPAVVVEIEPNTWYQRKTAPGGEWETEVRDNLGSRTDVTLTRRQESGAS
jgi:hypothetical protein